MVKKLVETIQGFVYADLVFILLGGLAVVALAGGLAFILTQKKASRHDR